MSGRIATARLAAVVTSSETVVIARPTPEVFGYTADLRNEPAWDVDVDELPRETDVVPEVGQRFDVRFAPFLGEAEGSLTVVAVLPDARLVWEADFAGMTSRITCLYEAEGSGTRFTRRVEVTPVGMLRLLAPLVAWRVRRSNRRDVVNLKRVLEAG
jgi:Polyketide cyclase / dehydrase and lipid transport